MAPPAERQDRKRVSVGDEEVKAVIDRLKRPRAARNIRIGEIFLSATPVNRAEVLGNANKIVDRAPAGRLVRRLCAPV